MKKLYLAMAALCWAGLAHAGEYHRMGQLRCTDCHTMHASRHHSLVDGGTTTFGGGTNTTQTPNDRLLIQNGVNATCLACHDGQSFAPDVLGASTGLAATGTRSAGHLNELADGAPTTNHGHTLETTDAPPGLPTGTTWSGSLECDSCHAVHGSRAYRNLGLGRYVATGNFTGIYPFANVGPSYTFVGTAGAVDPTVDVSINAGMVANPLSYLNGSLGAAANTSGQLYQTANIQFGKGSNNASNPYITGAITGATTGLLTTDPQNGMNNYCAVCHGNFHGSTNTLGSTDTTGTQHYIRHPTSGVAADTSMAGTFSATATFTGVVGTDPTQSLNSAQGDLVRAVFTATDKTAFEVGCLTCHKAHGNDRPFGLIFPSHVNSVTDYENGDAAALPDGSYPIRNLCVTCHPMGRTY